MVKLVDTQVSGTCGGNPVEVRVLFSAPLKFLKELAIPAEILNYYSNFQRRCSCFNPITVVKINTRPFPWLPNLVLYMLSQN